MTKPPDDLPEDQEKLSQILQKITLYQRSLPDGRAVELDELQSKGVLTPEDLALMSAKSVTYKPYGLSDHHRMAMLKIPTEGGCVFLGMRQITPKKRHARLSEFEPILQKFIAASLPPENVVLRIEFNEPSDMGVGIGIPPRFLIFKISMKDWRERLPLLRSVAAEFRFLSFEEKEAPGKHMLSFHFTSAAKNMDAVVMTLLRRGYGFSDDTELTYSSLALDEA